MKLKKSCKDKSIDIQCFSRGTCFQVQFDSWTIEISFIQILPVLTYTLWTLLHYRPLTSV